MIKQTKWVCAQRRLRSAWDSTQSDQSSPCAQWVAKDSSCLRIPAVFMRTVKTLLRLGRPDLSLRWAHTHFVGFDISRLKYTIFFSFLCYIRNAQWLPAKTFKTQPQHDKTNKMTCAASKDFSRMKIIWRDKNISRASCGRSSYPPSFMPVRAGPWQQNLRL